MTTQKQTGYFRRIELPLPWSLGVQEKEVCMEDEWLGAEVLVKPSGHQSSSTARSTGLVPSSAGFEILLDLLCMIPA